MEEGGPKASSCAVWPPERVHMASAAGPRVIRLNVGGHTFATARSTLEGLPYFQRLLSSFFTDLDAASGEAFIDRDGRYFHLLLNFLRSGMVELPTPPLSLEGLLAEAEYFGVDSLAAALRDRASDMEGASAVNTIPHLRADGSGIYVWEDKQQPGLVEAVLFEMTPAPLAVQAGVDSAVEPTVGTLIYSRGPCARENLLGLRSMPSPLPRVWRYARKPHRALVTNRPMFFSCASHPAYPCRFA